MNYRKGDTIHHPLHGIGTIQAFDEKELLGQKLTFAQLFFEREGLKLMLPQKKLDGTVRDPIDSKQAQEILEYIAELDSELHKSWKVRNRNNQQRLESGDPRQLGEVFKGLAALKSKKGSLNNSDRRQMQLSQDLLVEELAHALGKGETVTLELLLDRCGEDSANAA